tara:strand:+ start:411 stop:614 length:204 start_codon:yes stop_codon:yes gene_type:complete
MKKRPRRTPRSWKIVGTKVINYFYNNPHANSHDEISEKFNIDKSSIRKILSKELDRRFKNAERVRKL